MRFALVIGNGQYKTGTLATPANDAGLVADALTAAGFTVTGAQRSRSGDAAGNISRIPRPGFGRGTDAVALVYLAGYGLQFEGENYFVPVDADIARDVDVPLQAIRVSDFTQPLAAHARPRQDRHPRCGAAKPFRATAANPWRADSHLSIRRPAWRSRSMRRRARSAPDEQGPYGAYATALTEMIGAGGLSLDDIFARVRLRVSEQTQGAEVPWYASQIDGPFFMTERAADAPPPPNSMPLADIRNRPMRDFGNPDDAYAAAHRARHDRRLRAIPRVFIPTVRIRGASLRCWRSAAKRLPGAAA